MSKSSSSSSSSPSMMETLRNPTFLLGVGVATAFSGLFCLGKMCYRKLHVKHSKYKLIYFAGRGLAETVRYLLAIGELNYEDVRYPIKFDANSVERPEWDKDKDLYVYGKIPELHVDGFRISQSKSIERFLAKRLGLMGCHGGQEALVDAAGEQIRDIQTAMQKAKTESKEQKDTKDNALTKFYSSDLSDAFRLFSRQQTNDKFLIGGRLSLADIQLFSFLHNLIEDPLMISTLKSFPTIEKVYQNVLNLPQIQKWINIRPQTSF